MEFVFVVTREVVDSLFVPESGFTRCRGAIDFMKCLGQKGFYIERERAERDPNFKQVIPYVVLTTDQGFMFTYERLMGGGEERLHSKMSIGIGGHMNPVDDGSVRQAALRELREEVAIHGLVMNRMEPIGFVNDDTNEVGAVHLGVVFEMRVNPCPRHGEGDWLPSGHLLGSEDLPTSGRGRVRGRGRISSSRKSCPIWLTDTLPRCRLLSTSSHERRQA
jgi:predicted NUDIX family phosphoesterase